MARFSLQPENTGYRPRVHGNGFIQLDLNEQLRLHVWGDPRIPRQAVETPLHEHRFNFTSYVLRGAIVNTIVDWAPARNEVERGLATHEVHRAQTRVEQDTILVPTGEVGVCSPVAEHVMREGCEYSMRVGYLHRSDPRGLTVTVIRKNGRTLAQGGASPRVFVPIGAKPDNEFNRYAAPPEQLWQIIHDAIGAVVDVPV